MLLEKSEGCGCKVPIQHFHHYAGYKRGSYYNFWLDLLLVLEGKPLLHTVLEEFVKYWPFFVLNHIWCHPNDFIISCYTLDNK